MYPWACTTTNFKAQRLSDHCPWLVGCPSNLYQRSPFTSAFNSQINANTVLWTLLIFEMGKDHERDMSVIQHLNMLVQAHDHDLSSDDSHKSLECGTCTDPERFPSMIKLASEPVDTVEERHSLPSEEAKKSHVVHQTFQFPSSGTSTFQQASEPFANATKTFHGRESPQLLDVERKSKDSTGIRSHRDLV